MVAIIGAGPAGLSAAEILALRGFQPIVLEKNAFAGGQLQLANKPPKGKDHLVFHRPVSRRFENGAEIRFNIQATPQLVRDLNPYAVIVATGGSAVTPPIEGAGLSHVCTVTEILDGSVRLKNKRVTVIGSGMTGLETAEKLALDGNQLLVVEMLDQIAPGAHFQNLDDVLPRLKKYQANFITHHKLISITADAVILENTATGRRREEKTDHVVLAVGVRSNDKLALELAPHFPRLYTIGDARKVGRIAQAVRDGFDTAWKLV